jgi:hypothetical protein
VAEVNASSLADLFFKYCHFSSCTSFFAASFYSSSSHNLTQVASKGYCHFRHQNTAEEAALIGSIAPKKVSAGEDAGPGSGSTANNNNNNHQSNHSQGPQRIDTKGGNGGGGGASAWNSAGTWEEKDCSSWAHTCLTKYLKTAHAAAGVGDESLTNSPEAVVSFKYIQ